MHIPDGFLPVWSLAGGYAAAGVLCAWSCRRMREDEIPRTAVFTAAFFAASLIHFKMYITSVHLLLNGLVGVVLGRRCVAAILVGLFLQAVLFGHGGISVLGVNALIFGIPALAAGSLYRLWESRSGRWLAAAAGVCGGLGVFLSGVLFMGAVMLMGESFRKVAEFALLAHIPVMVAEGVVTGFTVDFINRVQPAVLRRVAT